MQSRHNQYDVTNTIDVTKVEPVCREVCRIYRSLYPKASTGLLEQAFADLGRLFHGHYPGYLACEAPYHDLQHTLDVTLAATRLLYGYEASHQGRERLGRMGMLIGIVCAMFHDAGYIRRKEDDNGHRHGAELTSKHVSRGCKFLQLYLPTIGLAHISRICVRLLHFTGYEVPVHVIDIAAPRLRLIGQMVGSADLIAQMADRCYLEKCRDRLYAEFVASGMASSDQPGGGYASGEELLSKTPLFFQHVMHDRLEGDFGSVYRYLEVFFADEGRDLYMEAIQKNQEHLEELLSQGDLSKLRREPNWTLNPDIPMLDLRRYRK